MAKINYDFMNKEGESLYNDGSIESELYRHYKYNEYLNKNREDVFFFTTNIRENIVNWYPFKKNSKILEIGSGVGTVTGTLVKNAKKVVSVEESRQRAEVVYERHKEWDNLEVYCGNFKNLKLNEKFDYIVLIGVYEYAKIFYDTEDAFDKFLKDIKSFLKEDGKILIAIENRLGIKYFSGLSEDHYKKPFVGLEGYNDQQKINTFGKEELIEIFKKQGLYSNFYHVYPDYKLPSYIFHDNYAPNDYLIDEIPIYNYYDDKTLFNGNNVLKKLKDNKIFSMFSNSFLIELTNSPKNFSNITSVRFQNSRAEEYRVATLVKEDEIEKIPVSQASYTHLKKLMEIHNLLNQNGINACNIQEQDGKFIIEKIMGKTLLEKIEEYEKANNEEMIIKIIDDFVDYLNQYAKIEKSENLLHSSLEIFGPQIKVLPYALLDLHLDNMIETKHGIVLIDQEWWDDRKLPIEYNIYVSLNILYQKIPALNRYKSIYDFYQKYNLTPEKIDAIMQTNHYFFQELKAFTDDTTREILLRKGTAQNIYERLEEIETIKNNLEVSQQDLQKRYDSLLERNKVLSEENDFVTDNMNDLKRLLKNQEKENQQKSHTILELEQSIHQQDHIIQTLSQKYNRKIYKIAGVFANGISKVLPQNSLRWKTVRAMWHVPKVGIQKTARVAYRLYPFRNQKRKWMNKLHNSRKLSKTLSVKYYHNLPTRTVISDHQEYMLKNITYVNKKIAVHIHLFYVDLANEFYQYLLNIPYTFDLYISVSDKRYMKQVKKVFKRNINIQKLVVKVSENVGRDYGPMFVLFNEELKNHDYLLHLHSKKSLRTGREQEEWRRYLLNNLLGTTELIMQYFDLMENWHVGLAYPETFPDITYIAHTYLGVKGLASQFLAKLGLKCEDIYMNFSAGSMFWCRVDTIRDVLDLNLSWEDFGKEEGQDDGTLAYVMERIFDPLTKKTGYNYAVFNNQENRFYLNYSNKNLSMYTNNTKESVQNTLLQYPIVTFDIFDTLVTRKIDNPDDVFDLIDTKISKRFNIEKGVYRKERKNAENEVRKHKNYMGDCTIDEIYQEMGKRLDLDQDTILCMKNIEIETDMNSIIPRKDMLEIYHELLKANRQIILISDMYYTKEIIEKILNQCGYQNYIDVLVSSEVGCRKDNGTMWDYFFEKYKNSTSIHVGDNEESDIHLLIKREKPNLHVMQGRKMYELSQYRTPINNLIENKVLRGLIVNKSMFNSPFALNENMDGGVINNLYDYGYSILAPIFLYFFIWLIGTTDKNTNLLFVSREGYYLQKIYNHIISKTTKPVENNHLYFLTSRRAATVANIKGLEDIRNILNTDYIGNLKELFYYRLGIMLPKNYTNEPIILPRDMDKVMRIAEQHLESILQNAQEERGNYLNYIKSVIDLEKNEDLCVVDLGYSGSVQYELSKLLDKKVSGAYFIVSDNLKPLSIGAKVKSCFNSTIYDNSFLKSPIGMYSLFLESFLTSDCGQLVKFDQNLNPVYLKEKDKQYQIQKLDEINNGIIDFITDMSTMLDTDIRTWKLDREFILNNFDKYVRNTGSYNTEIKETLKVEDLYTRNGEIKAIKE